MMWLALFDVAALAFGMVLAWPVDG